MRTFKLGEVVSILPDRKTPLQSDLPKKIVKIRNHGRFIQEVGHHQSLKLEGEIGWYSAWWFDESAPLLSIAIEDEEGIK